MPGPEDFGVKSERQQAMMAPPVAGSAACRSLFDEDSVAMGLPSRRRSHRSAPLLRTTRGAGPARSFRSCISSDEEYVPQPQSTRSSDLGDASAAPEGRFCLLRTARPPGPTFPGNFGSRLTLCFVATRYAALRRDRALNGWTA